ncbi:MAG: FmdB family zinc ribbon protein [Actinomycetota bacterium]
MAVYEYVCLACEHRFEERRSIETSSVDVAIACPSCGDERVRRRFSLFATGSMGSSTSEMPGPSATGGGCCGAGGCACGH